MLSHIFFVKLSSHDYYPMIVITYFLLYHSSHILVFISILFNHVRWDYKNKYYYDAINHLIHLKDMEKIKNIGLTNFDTEHLADLLEEGAPLVSNQVRSYH